MKETIVTWVEGNNYKAQMSRGEITISSQPQEENTLKPPEMILASLGTCGGLFLKPILKEMGIKWDEFEVKLKGKKAKPPKLFKEINMHYEIKAEISDQELEEALQKSHKKCLVMNTLNPNIKINTTFEIL